MFTIFKKWDTLAVCNGKEALSSCPLQPAPLDVRRPEDPEGEQAECG